MSTITAPKAGPRGGARLLLWIVAIGAVAFTALTLLTGALTLIVHAPWAQPAVPVIAMVDELAGMDVVGVEAFTRVPDAPAGIAVLVTTAMVLGVLASASIGGGLATLAITVLRGRPFSEAARGGIAWIAMGFATAFLASALQGAASMWGAELLGPSFGGMSVVDLGTLLTLGVLGIVLLLWRIAERSQRDAEGLV